MHDRIHQILIAWGEWGSKRASSSLGYPSSSVTFRLVQPSSQYGTIIPIDLELVEIDAIMGDLNREAPELYKVAVDWYVCRKNISEIAKRQSCARDTVYARIDKVTAYVLRRLSKKTAA